MINRGRVVVAMSGGVDSSVAAALLKKQGYEVIGITLCFSAAGGSASGGNLPDAVTKKPRCCGRQGIEDARAVADKLGIRHYVLNMQRVLEEKVIKEFCFEYLNGRTPNPCVRCNQYVKFAALLKRAMSLGAQYLATGHYARIVKAKSAKRKAQNYLLKKSKDSRKDQSYFLYRLNQKQLSHILFPLGDYTKGQVRGLARKFKLPVAEKAESQEICFLPEDNYRGFLAERLSKYKPRFIRALRPGPIVDTGGKVLGQHKGIAFYTIGQRQGLGIAFGRPVYIIRIDRRDNRLVVGTKEEASSREFLVKDAHFVSAPLKKKVALKVKIRYNHAETPAEVIPGSGFLKVSCKTPQFAVTPGQSAVFYSQDTVIGGGIIDKIAG
jgi:tRNA-specific 2-thiouridylase